MRALSQAEVRLARLEQRNHEREAAMQARDEEIRGLKEIIKTLQAQHLSALDEVQRRGETLRAVRAGFENSTSWKVTKPLRWVMQHLRGTPDPSQPLHDEADPVVPPALVSPSVPLSAPANELQWLQRLECDRSDYGTWLAAFEAADEQNGSVGQGQGQAVHAAQGEGGTGLVVVSFVSLLAPGAAGEPLLHALNAIKGGLAQQTVPDWEWLILADAYQADALSPWTAAEPRIRVLQQDAAQDIASRINAALMSEAHGRCFSWMDTSFVLRPGALHAALAALEQRPDTHVLYADEDALDEDERRLAPNFYCDYNPDLWLSGDPLGRWVLFQADAVRQAGAFAGIDPATMRHDLLLRMAERCEDPNRQMLHLPQILSHRLDKRSVDAFASPVALLQLVGQGTAAASATDPAQTVQTVQRHLDRSGVAATALPHPDLPGHCRVRFALPKPTPKVGIVIPTRDNVGVLSVCLDTLLECSTYPDFNVVVVDNGSCNPETLHYLQAITDPRVKVIRDDAPFNFSRVVNTGVAAVDGEVVCLLNNDMEITQPDWLEEMAGWAIQPGVAAVGARLWYGEGLLQHGGIVLGIQGMAGHAHKFLKRGDPGYMNRAELHQTMSAVTGACMVVRRSVYDELGGFDEALGVAYNDVDFCLRARKAGYRNVWTPHAEMIHHESISRGFEDSPEKQARFQREAALMRERWGEWLADDPAYNPNLTLEHEDFGLAWPPRKRSS